MHFSEIFTIDNQAQFEEMCMQVFCHQIGSNEVYQEFVRLLGRRPDTIKNVEQIPFLPIEFFKSRDILSSPRQVEAVFTSSGTTGAIPSRHLVTDLSVYRKSFTLGFNHFYGSPDDYIILALLPSYLRQPRRTGASEADPGQQREHPVFGLGGSAGDRIDVRESERVARFDRHRAHLEPRADDRCEVDLLEVR